MREKEKERERVIENYGLTGEQLSKLWISYEWGWGWCGRTSWIIIINAMACIYVIISKSRSKYKTFYRPLGWWWEYGFAVDDERRDDRMIIINMGCIFSKDWYSELRMGVLSICLIECDYIPLTNVPYLGCTIMSIHWGTALGFQVRKK